MIMDSLEWLVTDNAPIEPCHVGKLVMISIDTAKAGIKTDPPVPNLLVYGRLIEVRAGMIRISRHATLADDPVSDIPYGAIKKYCWAKDASP